MGTDEHVCSECGQPVATVLKRYKTLGAWVPKWGPGPCRNPKCRAYADAAEGEQPRAAVRPGDTAGKET